MTPKIVEATEVQFEEVKVVEEPRFISKAAKDALIQEEMVEQITLHDIVLYDIEKKPYRAYETIIIDGKAARVGEKYLALSQDQWIARARAKGKEILSVPLLYAILEKLHTEHHPAETSFVREIKESWFCTSTRLNYAKGTIAQGYGFPSQDNLPCSFPEENKYMANTKYYSHYYSNWGHFLQSLLQVRDLELATKILKDSVGVPPYIWMASRDYKLTPERAVFLSASKVKNIISCNIPLPTEGCSRLVELK